MANADFADSFISPSVRNPKPPPLPTVRKPRRNQQRPVKQPSLLDQYKAGKLDDDEALKLLNESRLKLQRQAVNQQQQEIGLLRQQINQQNLASTAQNTAIQRQLDLTTGFISQYQQQIALAEKQQRVDARRAKLEQVRTSMVLGQQNEVAAGQTSLIAKQNARASRLSRMGSGVQTLIGTERT